MLLLASLLVTATLAPAPEIRNPMGPTAARPVPGEAVVPSCPCTCGDAELREPFSTAPRPRAAVRLAASVEPALRDPFDAPRRARAPILREPSPIRRVRTPEPRPPGGPDELRSPFSRA